MAIEDKTLVAVLAHADDETPVGPVLARYAREGVRVLLIVASDGMKGSGPGRHGIRPDSGPEGEELVRVRAEEAHCSAKALGAEPPILLGFPDGALGHYTADRTLLHRLMGRLAEELEQIRPDALITWGPDGGTGHPDHRIISGITTQMVRAGAPGAPQRLFYMSVPPEAFSVLDPQRGEPPLLIPRASHFTVEVPFEPVDLEAARRAMACHRSQFSEEFQQRIFAVHERSWSGRISFVPEFAEHAGTDLFH